MHPNPAFRATPEAEALAFARARAFGQLTICGDEGPIAAHVPFVIDADGGALGLHVMRSNPLARVLGEVKPALMAVTGPDAYVSPDWYGLADQVPTWNYIAVHLRGPLELLPPESLRSLLDRLSDAMEARLDKQPWTSAKMSPGVMERMMRSLVPARMRIESVDSTWKLNQNKPDTARVQAAERIAGARSPGSEHAALAALMRAVSPQI